MSDYLRNAEWWTTRDGRTLRIVDMEPGHARNTKNMLLRNAQGIVTRRAFAADWAAAGHDGGEVAHSCLEREAAELWRAAETPKGSVDYVKRTPTFRALKRRSRKKS